MRPLSIGIPCHSNSCNVLFMRLTKVNCFFVVMHYKTKVFGSDRPQESSNLHNQSCFLFLSKGMHTHVDIMENPPYVCPI